MRFFGSSSVFFVPSYSHTSFCLFVQHRFKFLELQKKNPKRKRIETKILGSSSRTIFLRNLHTIRHSGGGNFYSNFEITFALKTLNIFIYYLLRQFNVNYFECGKLLLVCSMCCLTFFSLLYILNTRYNGSQSIGPSNWSKELLPYFAKKYKLFEKNTIKTPFETF